MCLQRYTTTTTITAIVTPPPAALPAIITELSEEPSRSKNYKLKTSTLVYTTINSIVKKHSDFRL